MDGSGLSPQDAIAPATLVKVVELATADARVRALLAGLPVAGFSGTLSAGQSVFSGIGGAALGSVRAKTGNLGTVTALAGLVTDKNGTDARLRLHGRPDPGRGDAADGRERHRRGRRRPGQLRLPVTGAS